MTGTRLVLAVILAISVARHAAAEQERDDRASQYPTGLADSFVGINIGALNYPFSSVQLEGGHRAESIAAPRVAVQAVLFGHHFGPFLSAQATYMRPVNYVKYRNIEEHGTRSVWMHYGTLTMRARAPLMRRLSLYGEGGMAVSNRKGFDLGESPGVANAHFWSPLAGGGVEYHARPTWDLIAGVSYIPRHSEDKQPATLFASAGFRYNMRKLSDDRVAETRAAGFFFPRQLIQTGYSTHALGFGANNFVSKTVPIFWGGAVEVRHSAFALHYVRNLFHSKKLFSFDAGVSYGRWTSEGRQGFQTFSAYPLMRFTFLRRRVADAYLSYSLAGPSYISRTVIDGLDTGSHFTFQDFMGLGAFIGRTRHLNVEIGINHYSNGNLFSENAGVKIPLTLKLGYAF